MKIPFCISTLCIALATPTASVVAPMTVTVRAEPVAVSSLLSREGMIVTKRVDEIFDQLEATGDFEDAKTQLSGLFETVVAYVSPRKTDAYREAAWPRRLIGLLSHVDDEDERIELLSFLRLHTDLAKALAYLVDIEHESPEEVFAILQYLRTEHEDALNDFANLTAAICVVHDKALVRQINENRATAPDASALFDYYSTNDRHLNFGARDVPAELLIYVVDSTTSIPEMQWAANRYAGDRLIGGRFFDIQYDLEHYRTGSPKKSTVAGWNLPNILQYGGVCADQAYFAVEAGKAIGVPTAYTIGRGGDVGHAWVGFLQADRRSAWWNFNAGRYEAYQGVKGIVLDPQTREWVDDSTVSLLADFALSDQNDRQTAAALVDAAKLLREKEKNNVTFEPDPLVESRTNRRHRILHPPELESQLELLEAGLRASPGYADGWFFLRDIAATNALSLQQKKEWAHVLDRLCGQAYPDFNLAILKPMIASVDDIAEQNMLWNTTFNNFSRRADLAAEIRIAQAEMWINAGETQKAGQCYMDVINRFANAGPFVLEALAKAEQLLIDSGRADEVVQLFDITWNQIKQPEQMAGQFVTQSNWFRVGMALANRLDKVGQSERAVAVRQRIGLR